MHSEQLCRRPQLVVFTCVTSVREPTRSQFYRKGTRKKNVLDLPGLRVTNCLWIQTWIPTSLANTYNSLDITSYSQLAEALGIRPDPQGHWAGLQPARLDGGVRPLGSRQGVRHHNITVPGPGTLVTCMQGTLSAATACARWMGNLLGY